MIVAYKRHTSPRAGSYAHDTQHEKIIRGVAIGMALIMCVLNLPNPGVAACQWQADWDGGWGHRWAAADRRGDAVGTRLGRGQGRGQGHRRL